MISTYTTCVIICEGCGISSDFSRMEWDSEFKNTLENYGKPNPLDNPHVKPKGMRKLSRQYGWIGKRGVGDLCPNCARKFKNEKHL